MSASAQPWRVTKAGLALRVRVTPRSSREGVDGLEVTVDSESDDQGILGISADVPAGPLSMRVAVHAASSDSDGARIRAAIEDAVARCPVHDAVIRAVPVEVIVEIA